MADDRSIRVRLIAEISQYQAGLARAGRATSEFGRNVSGMGKATSADMEQVGRSAVLMAGGMAVGLGLAAKAAIDWESSWAGVTKTVNGTAEQMSGLEQGLRDMAKELPASHAEIAGVAEAAGQLGVAVTDVESFTRVMVDLGETTNLTADEAATSLARVANIMGTTGADIERMGSTIVELGNNSATTEAEIVELGTRLAAAGKIAGLSEADVFAFASTLTSVGVEAEAGGTALSKVFTAIRDAVIDGSDSLDIFANTAGVSADEFSRAFRENAAGAINLFIQGLGRMNDAGQSTTQVFSDLELTDQRLMRALLSTASAGELLTDQLEMGNAAWEENTALAAEAEQRYATTAAQMEMLRNKVTDLAIDAGQVLLPALNGVVDVLGSVATGLGELPGPVQTASVGLAGIATGALGIVGTLGIMAPKIQALKTSLEGMGSAGQFASRNMGKFAGALGVAGLAIAGLSWYLGKQAEAQAAAQAAADGYTEAMKEQGGVVGELTDEYALLAIMEGEVGTALREAEADLSVFADTLRTTPEIAGQLESQMNDLVQALGMDRGVARALEESGIAATELGSELGRLYESGDLTAGQIYALVGRLEDQAAAAANGAEALGNETAAVEAAGTAAEEAVEPTEDYAAAQEEAADKAKEFEDAIKNVTSAIRSQLDPLWATQDALDGHREAQDELKGANLEWLAATADVDKAIKEHGRKSDEAAAAWLRQLDAKRKVEEIDQKVRRSALDVMAATTELKMRVDEGNVSLEAAEQQLRDMAAAGLITEEQAYKTAQEIRGTTSAAQELGRQDTTVQIRADASGFWNEWNNILRTTNSGVDGTITVNGVTNRYQAKGGPVSPMYLAHGGGPRGTDTVPTWLTPGEFVIRKSSVDKYGLGMMDAINRGRLTAPSQGGGGIDYGRLAGAVRAAGGVQVTVNKGDQLDENTIAAIVARKVAA